MNKNSWRIMNFADPSSLPAHKQPIDFSIAEGEGAPFTEPGRLNVDLKIFREIMKQNPHCLIIWQPSPPPSAPPTVYQVVEKTLCSAQQDRQNSCKCCRSGSCLLPDHEACAYQKKALELVYTGGGDDR